MKIQKLCLLLFMLLCFFDSKSQSVAKNPVFENWEARLAKSGLGATIVAKIKTIIESRDKKLALFQKEQLEQELNNPIAFLDPEATANFHRQLLIKELSKIINLEQFK